jgi:hypothetical protein
MMKNIILRILPMCLILLFLPALLFADTSRFAVGIGYPYFLIKYSPLEVKYATGDGINVFAGRLYLIFYQNNTVKGYTGVEGGYIKFNSLDIKGSGYEGSLFIGGEYFVTENLSLSADIAPTYIGLKSNDHYSVGGLEIVSNLSVNYYFSRKAEESTAEADSDTNDQSVDDNKALIKTYLEKAQQFYDEGKYRRAISEYKKVLSLDPDNKTAKEEIEQAKIMIDGE